jgi:hypothetical protein
MKKAVAVTRCKYCKSILNPDGGPLKVATPAMIRVMLGALKYGHLGGEFYVVDKLKELGYVEDSFVLPPKKRRAAMRRYLAIVRRAAKEPYAGARKIIRDADAYRIDRKESRLTPLGTAVAKWYASRLAPTGKEST